MKIGEQAGYGGWSDAKSMKVIRLRCGAKYPGLKAGGSDAGR